MDAQTDLNAFPRTETLEVLSRFRDNTVLQKLLSNTHDVAEAVGLCTRNSATIFIASGGDLRLANGHSLGSISLGKDGFLASYSDTDMMGFGGCENDVPINDAALEFIAQNLQIEEPQIMRGIRMFLASGFGTSGGGFFTVCQGGNRERLLSDIMGSTEHYPELHTATDPEQRAESEV